MVTKKRQFSSTDPGGSFCEQRFDKVRHDHHLIEQRLDYEWCEYKKAVAKLEEKRPPSNNPVHTNRSCTHFQPLIICTEHWDIYHGIGNK